LRAQGTQNNIAIFDDCVEIWNAKSASNKRPTFHPEPIHFDWHLKEKFLG